MQQTADFFIDKLNMQPHPEGGYYCETFRSPEQIPVNALPLRYTGKRNFYTGIYFLMQGDNFSAFHRLKSDEMWHYYHGNSMFVYVIAEDGRLSVIKLGININDGEVFQALVPAGCWFASHPKNFNSFSLVGCTVAPGFDFDDFEMARRQNLIELFPQHKEIITALTRS